MKTERAVVAKVISDPTDKRRVVILRRSDGRYSVGEEFFSDEPSENYWLQTPRHLATIWDTAEAAEREARSRVEWLRDLAI